ncbi:hypothetical protein M2404_002001 [Rheinheimera pacifica]|uniref:hypothetical protein n=1 Tax=Rheinheimera pacifica TaxID=173990 RepID=UPI00216AA525|nr:hypothetical protein [Rheinheimera pacifica]MCS4307661.1 hypothetical protein [Rheinheimera pacifica]
MEHWLRTDERQEFISSMRMVRKCLISVSDDIEQWKWAVIALHNAAQGAMVQALRAGNDFRIMPEKLAQKCYQAHRDNKPWPKAKMDSFPNLYKKVQSQEMMLFYTHSKTLPCDTDRDYCVSKLLELRNSFIHFMPQGWTLEVSGLPHIFISLIEMISYLCWESRNVIWYEEGQSTTARELVSECLSAARQLSDSYAN